MLGVIKQANWVDLFIIILVFRICYISVRSGLPNEIFKLFGTAVAIYLSLHYYSALSDFLWEQPALKFIPKHLLGLVIFLILATFGYLVFIFLREFFNRLIKIEPSPQLARWGSLGLGIVRGILLTSLILFILVISGLDYFRNSVIDSSLGGRLIHAAPATYNGIFKTVMSKFMTGEEFNKSILQVQENLKE